MKIVLENIHKYYGSRAVVSRVNIFIDQGEIVGLLGPNGAGKTTTFYIATGLEKPSLGTVFFNELDITALPMDKRAKLGIGYLAQEPSIFRNLSVKDNILLVLEQTKVPRREWKQRLEFLLNEFRLEKIASTNGSQVSGGERRRTELARALASNRDGLKFLFLDEPFAGVDPIAISEIQKIVAKLGEQNMGILITEL